MAVGRLLWPLLLAFLLSLHGLPAEGWPGSRVQAVFAGLPLLGLAGFWALSETLEWYGRRWLLRLPFWASFALIASGAVALLAGLAWLMLFASAGLWQGLWLALLLSGLALLAVLLALRLAAWRAGTGLRLDRLGLGPQRPDLSAHERVALAVSLSPFGWLAVAARWWPGRWSLRAG